MSVPSPAAAWMDRLSDLFGTFIPGGSRLPPRHPLKVSLVMGMLGLASGWLTMAAGGAAVEWVFPTSHRDSVLFAAAGGLFGMTVLVPWAAWLGTRIRWQLLLVPFSFVANFVCWQVINEIGQRSGFSIAAILFGLLTGAYLGLAGLCLKQRWLVSWLVIFMIVNAGAGWFTQSFVGNQLLDQYVWSPIKMPLVIAWFFSTIHLPSAIFLGCLLWDRTPRLKFEPNEDSHARAAH